MKKHSVLILLLILISCSGDDDNSSGNNQVLVDSIHLVTGIDIKSDEFSAPIRLGNPNTFVNQTIVFPNPTSDIIVLKTLSGEAMQAAWIIEGNKEVIFQNTDFSAILNSDTYTTQLIENNAALQFPTLSNETSINLENIDDGYYRVFIQINDTIEWHNFYKGSVDITNFIESWE